MIYLPLFSWLFAFLMPCKKRNTSKTNKPTIANGKYLMLVCYYRVLITIAEEKLFVEFAQLGYFKCCRAISNCSTSGYTHNRKKHTYVTLCHIHKAFVANTNNFTPI